VDFEQTNRCARTRVVRFRTLDALAPLAGDWDRLARGVPFRSWAWMSNWWRHYGDDQDESEGKTSLFVLGVLDPAGTVIGIAPWYLESSAAEGRVVRFLGTGEVCSDYLSVLCEPGMEDAVTGTLAEWLTLVPDARGDHSVGRDQDSWDLLELTSVDAQDAPVARLADELQARGNTVHRRAGPNCWRIELPTNWGEYSGRLSKGHRKQVRRAVQGILATGRVTVHSVRRLEDLPRAQEVLVDLHQRRRRSLGEPGCFSSSRFAAFHRDVMPELLLGGQLFLEWLDLDGEPVAAEYGLIGDGVVYVYQAGVNPDALEHSPGRLSHITMLRRAIEQGYRALDFLRGDEPYKAHWRAEPRGSLEIRVVPARPAARLRHAAWLVGTNVKQWIKRGLLAVTQ